MVTKVSQLISNSQLPLGAQAVHSGAFLMDYVRLAKQRCQQKADIILIIETSRKLASFCQF